MTFTKPSKRATLTIDDSLSNYFGDLDASGISIKTAHQIGHTKKEEQPLGAEVLIPIEGDEAESNA